MAIINQWPMSETKVLGGGGPGMYSIVLPRSVYYEEAAEWVQVSTQSPTGDYRRQVIVGNSLWVFDGSSAYEIDLDTGLTINTVTGCSLGSGANSDGTDVTSGDNRRYYTKKYTYPGNVVTDGTNIYWGAGSSLMQLNTTTRAVTNLGSIGKNGGGRTLVYSPFDNSIYFVGGSHRDNSYWTSSGRSYYKYYLLSDSTVQKYSIDNNLITTCANLPIGLVGAYVYADETTGEIYIGCGYTYTGDQTGNTNQSGSWNQNIYKFNPSTNTYTTIFTGFSYLLGDTYSYVSMGNRMLAFNGQNVYSWNPKTGETYVDQMPEPLTDAVLFNNVAVKDNSLYSSQGSGLWRCVFYENLPADAPIVAKIYKGQKYHTLQPFTIHGEGGDVNVTTTQQTAAADIPIKMYTYDNAGGQILIIENGGE